jgi:hypothetical protein
MSKPGSRYPASDNIAPELRGLAETLGKRLANVGIRVTTASLLGATVGYALLDELGDRYEADRMMLVRRRRDAEIDQPNLRNGAITFIGEDPATLRDSVFDQVRAVIILGGGVGTQEEVERARARNMGVVPLALTGGTAFAVWEAMMASLDEFELGGRPIDPLAFEGLNSADYTVAIDSAVSLVLQAMYLPLETPPPPIEV